MLFDKEDTLRMLCMTEPKIAAATILADSIGWTAEGVLSRIKKMKIIHVPMKSSPLFKGINPDCSLLKSVSEDSLKLAKQYLAEIFTSAI